jgi:hypothetical protein
VCLALGGRAGVVTLWWFSLPIGTVIITISIIIIIITIITLSHNDINQKRHFRTP